MLGHVTDQSARTVYGCQDLYDAKLHGHESGGAVVQP
jgi:hypothetical protein